MGIDHLDDCDRINHSVDFLGICAWQEQAMTARAVAAAGWG